MSKFVKHTRESLALDCKKARETNDCAVRALAVVCGVKYGDARLALATCGRKPHKGAYIPQWTKAAQMLGYELVDVRFLVKGKTVRTVERDLRGAFAGKQVLIDQPGHVAAWDGRTVLDWSKGRLKRVEGVYLAHKVPVFS